MLQKSNYPLIQFESCLLVTNMTYENKTQKGLNLPRSPLRVKTNRCAAIITAIIVLNNFAIQRRLPELDDVQIPPEEEEMEDAGDNLGYRAPFAEAHFA